MGEFGRYLQAEYVSASPHAPQLTKLSKTVPDPFCLFESARPFELAAPPSERGRIRLHRSLPAAWEEDAAFEVGLVVVGIVG